MFKSYAVLASLIISTSSFAANEPYSHGRQERLQMGAGVMNLAKRAATQDGDLQLVVYCEDQDQAVLNGGCSISGPVSKNGSAAASSGILQKFGPSFDMWTGIETYVCHYTNVKKGDIVAAAATCK